MKNNRLLALFASASIVASCCGDAEPQYVDNPVDYVSTLVGSESTFQLSTGIPTLQWQCHGG